MSRNKSVVIVGGGVVGASCGYYLQREGFHVTIVDQKGFGSGCSHGNCGYVCPSHVLPLASPGAIKSTFWALFKPNSPFSIKPRLDFRLWSWLLNFARSCNEQQMLRGGHALQSLLVSSMNEFEQLVEQGTISCEWEKKGLLYAYRDKIRLDAYDKTNALMKEVFQEPAEKLSPDELQKLEPALQPDLAGGWFYEQDAHLRSDRLMSSWRSLLEANGATIREGVSVSGFVRDNGRAVAVQTSVGELAADKFVVATGAWTPTLERALGCKIPIQPGKGYSITMPRPSICPEHPLIFPEQRVAVTPFQSGYRLGSIMEFAGYDESIRPERIALLRDGARKYLREPYRDEVEEEWFGWRPMTYDSLPIIGRTPAMENVFLAAGHNMIGLSMSTGTGKLISELVADKTPHIDPAPFSVARFH